MRNQFADLNKAIDSHQGMLADMIRRHLDGRENSLGTFLVVLGRFLRICSGYRLYKVVEQAVLKIVLDPATPLVEIIETAAAVRSDIIDECLASPDARDPDGNRSWGAVLAARDDLESLHLVVVMARLRSLESPQDVLHAAEMILVRAIRHEDARADRLDLEPRSRVALRDGESVPAWLRIVERTSGFDDDSWWLRSIALAEMEPLLAALREEWRKNPHFLSAPKRAKRTKRSKRE